MSLADMLNYLAARRVRWRCVHCGCKRPVVKVQGRYTCMLCAEAHGVNTIGLLFRKDWKNT